MNKALKKQPRPKPGNINVGEIVIQDMESRIRMGKRKHGVVLQINNGRDAMWDAYQEALDLVMYLRQVILEKENDKTGNKK